MFAKLAQAVVLILFETGDTGGKLSIGTQYNNRDFFWSYITIWWKQYNQISIYSLKSIACKYHFACQDKYQDGYLHSFSAPYIGYWNCNFMTTGIQGAHPINTLGPRRHFEDDIFKCIFVNENVWIPIKISLKFVHKGLINNIPALG